MNLLLNIGHSIECNFLFLYLSALGILEKCFLVRNGGIVCCLIQFCTLMVSFML